MTLTAIACVVRAKAPALESINHVAELLDELLDVSVSFSLEQAVVFGDVRLFDRVYCRLVQTQPAMDPCLMEATISKAMETAVKNNHLNIVQRIHELFQHRLPVRLLPLAAETGDLLMFQWLITHRTDDFCAPHGQQDDTCTAFQQLSCCLHDASDRAIGKEQLHIVKWLYENGYIGQRNWMHAAGDVAASVGNLEMVMWFHALPPSLHLFSTFAIDKAARGGHAQVVAFLLANRSEGFTSAAIHGALFGGHVEILQKLRIEAARKAANGDESQTGMWVREAAQIGRLDLLQMDEYKMKCPMVVRTVLFPACSNGHRDVVEWLIATYQSPCPSEAVTATAKNGHLHLLEWLHESGHGVWRVDVMDEAARRGDLEMVNWLHTNRGEGCSVYAMANAAAAGHLDVVQWLHGHRSEGCTTEAMDSAAAGGHLEVVKWLHENRTEGCTTNAMAFAAARNHQHVVEWLHENRAEGCTTRAMDEAASNDHLEMVIWLHTHRTEGCSTFAMNLASLPVVKWLHQNRTEGCTTTAMDRAAETGDIGMLMFLHDHRNEGCSASAAVEASIKGHLYVVQCLQEWYPLVFDWPRVEEATRHWKHDHIVAWIEASQHGNATA